MNINYQRQNSLTDLFVPEALTVIGTGAIGCWLTYFAAMSGVKRIVIYTIGSVKQSDIARFPFPPQMVGKPYAFALTSLIFSIRPEIELTINGKFTPEIDQLEGFVYNCAASEFNDFDMRLYTQSSQLKALSLS